MARVNVIDALNGRFACRHCHASGGWISTAKPVSRMNSTIHWLRCSQCGERVVAKANNEPASKGRVGAEVRVEYETLEALGSAFPQDDHYGILMPLGYLESGGHGIMITRFCPGNDLARELGTLDAAGVRVALHSAGVWLHRLHGCGTRPLPERPLDVADKLDYLDQEYGAALGSDPHARDVRDLLARVGDSIADTPVAVARLHGDFKPHNILCDGTRFVGLDIHWNLTGPTVYDVARFLNHVNLANPLWKRTPPVLRDDAVAADFLAGYGGTCNPRALHWARLYYAMCHLGGYRRRGVSGRAYARWKVWPLAQALATAMPEIG